MLGAKSYSGFLFTAVTTGGCDMMMSALYGISKVANQQFSSASFHKDPVIAVLLTLYNPRKLLRMLWLKQACNL